MSDPRLYVGRDQIIAATERKGVSAALLVDGETVVDVADVAEVLDELAAETAEEVGHLVYVGSALLDWRRRRDEGRLVTDGGLPDDHSMRCYDCERVFDRRHVSLTDVPVDNVDGPGYEYVPVPLCEDCRLRRYGVPCDNCDGFHWDHEAVFECRRDRGRLVADGGTCGAGRYSPGRDDYQLGKYACEVCKTTREHSVPADRRISAVELLECEECNDETWHRYRPGTARYLPTDSNQGIVTDGGRDDVVLRLIEVAEELDELESALRERDDALGTVTGSTCGQLSSLCLDMAHELEETPVVATDGGEDIESEWTLVCTDCDFEDELVADGHPRDGPPREVEQRVREHKGTVDWSHVVRVEGRRADRSDELDPSLLTDGGFDDDAELTGEWIVLTRDGPGDILGVRTITKPDLNAKTRGYGFLKSEAWDELRARVDVDSLPPGTEIATVRIDCETWDYSVEYHVDVEPLGIRDQIRRLVTDGGVDEDLDRLTGVDGIGESTAEDLLDEFGTLEELVERCRDVPQGSAPVRISRMDGYGPASAKRIAKAIDESDLADDPELVTDGGSKYTVPTGPGYLGVWQVSNRRVNIAIGTFTAVEWLSDQTVWAVEDDSGVGIVDERPEEPIDECPIKKTVLGTSVILRRPVVEVLGVENGEDVRAYEREGGGLTVVVADEDPFVDDEVLTDGGYDYNLGEPGVPDGEGESFGELAERLRRENDGVPKPLRSAHQRGLDRVFQGFPEFLSEDVLEDLEEHGVDVPDDLRPQLGGVRGGLWREDVPTVVATVLEQVHGRVEIEARPSDDAGHHWEVEWHRLEDDAELVTDGGRDLPIPSEWDYAAVVHGVDRVYGGCLAVTNAGKPCTNNAYDGPFCGMHDDVDEPDVIEGAHQWARIKEGPRVVAVCINCRAVWQGGPPALRIPCPDCSADVGDRCGTEASVYSQGGTHAPVRPHPGRRRQAWDDGVYEPCPCYPLDIDDSEVLATDGGVTYSCDLCGRSHPTMDAAIRCCDDEFDDDLDGGPRGYTPLNPSAAAAEGDGSP